MVKVFKVSKYQVAEPAVELRCDGLQDLGFVLLSGKLFRRL
jgi:hypothetical protein